jgi:tetratricopeptide (TPR) repeat protein
VTGALGGRLRDLRLRAGMTQAQLAGERYTGAYISALENGLVRASMAALAYLGERLDVSPEDLLRETAPQWERLEADLQLAAGNWEPAADRYTKLLERRQSKTKTALLLRGRAEAYCRLGRAHDALTDAAAAYEALRQAGSHVDAVYAGYWLAYAHHQLDNVAESRAIAHQLLAEIRAGLSVQADFKVRLLVGLATNESWDGRHDRALAFLEEARALTDELDDRGRASFLFSLANGFAQTGDHEAALRAGSEALGLFEAIDAKREAGSLRNTLAMTNLQLGNVSRAAELATEGRALVERFGDRRLLAHVAETQAQIALAQHDDEAVNHFANEALEVARSTGNGHAEASALLTLARWHRDRSEPAKAEETYAEAATLLRRIGPKARLAEVLREWADLLVTQERHEEAVELLQEALSG